MTKRRLTIVFKKQKQITNDRACIYYTRHIGCFFGILTFFSISFIFLLLALHFNAMLACFLVRFILFYCQFLRLFFIIHKNKREEREKISIKIENISSYKRAQRTQPRSKNIYFSILIKPDILSQNRNSLRIFRPLV